MDYIDYRKQLGIDFNDSEKQKLFVKRIHTLFLTRYEVEFCENEDIKFCCEMGFESLIEKRDMQHLILSKNNEPLGMKRLFYYLDSYSKDFYDYLYGILTFLNICVFDSEIKISMFNAVKTALESCHIQYDCFQENEKYFIFPKGAKELDRALVSEPLEWLSNYPNSRKSFVKALELYSNSTNNNASDVADAFRKALETFFQDFFELKDLTIEKTLERNVYERYLKEKEIPGEIRNNFRSLLDSYRNFMNNYAKHHDKTTNSILEYIMYQTGNIIRLLITLKHSEEK